MAEYEAVTLRLDPRAIPAMRAAFENALAELRPALARLGEVGHIHGAWMGDPQSEEVVAFYNDRVMDAVDGPYQALLQYEKELRRVHKQLTVMELEYQRVESENAEGFEAVL